MNRLIIALSMIMIMADAGVAQYPVIDMTVKSMEGKISPLSQYINNDDGHITLFCFWKTCCPTNLNMIDSLLEITDEYGKSGKLTVVLVSVDDTRTGNRVMPVVRMKGWEADVILDVSMELARAMSVNAPPQWVATDNEGKIIFRRKITEGEADVEYYFNELISKIKSS